MRRIGKAEKRITHVVVVFLHGYHPRNIVESDGTQAEVSVVGNLAYLFNESIEVGGGYAIDSGDEVSRSKPVVVSG